MVVTSPTRIPVLLALHAHPARDHRTDSSREHIPNDDQSHTATAQSRDTILVSAEQPPRADGDITWTLLATGLRNEAPTGLDDDVVYPKARCRENSIAESRLDRH